MQKVIFLISASLGNFFLAGYFLQALLFPKDHIDFIYSMGFVLFLLEFLNIHSTGMIMGLLEQKGGSTLRDKGFLLILYSIFYLVAFSVAKNYYIVISAIISFISKLFFKQALPKETSSFAVSAVLIIILPLFLAIFGELIKLIIPFPEEVYLSKPNSSGVFVDIPQTLLLWGVLYYSFLGIFEIVAFKKSRK